MEKLTLANLLRRKIIDYGYTSVVKLSHDIGIYDYTIYNWINGNTIGMSKDSRIKICDFFDIAPEFLDNVILHS